MKSMLSDLDFSNVKFEPGDKTKLLTGGRNAAVELIRRHEDNLRTALAAALVVIESSGAYEQKYAELAANMGSINQDWRMLDRLKLKASVAYVELETALKPFKVAGDDAKDGGK